MLVCFARFSATPRRSIQNDDAGVITDYTGFGLLKKYSSNEDSVRGWSHLVNRRRRNKKLGSKLPYTINLLLRSIW